MARISTYRPASPAVASPTDQLNAELGQLLHRLQYSILYVDADRERRLRSSELERARIEKNLAYARSVLTRLEQESLGLKAHLLRQDVQSDLDRKREVLEVLMDRMHDLAVMRIEEEEDDDTDSQGEDLLADIIPTPSESMDSRSADHSSDPGHQEDEPELLEPHTGEGVSARLPADIPVQEASRTEPPHSVEPTSAPSQASPPLPTATTAATTTTSQTLRPRRQRAPSPTSARGALLARKSSTAPSQSATAEALLDRERGEQDSLIENILGYASALKDSSQRFQESLEKDRMALERAAEGMDRAGTGMEGAKRRMGILTRMTEGKGWWGRMMLFAWVYGLMVVLVLVVFVLPKIRF